jgi:hypothetical protein
MVPLQAVTCQLVFVLNNPVCRKLTEFLLDDLEDLLLVKLLW